MKKILFIFGILVVTFSNSSPLLNTTLSVTVRDGTGNLVHEAMVKLYENEQDYLKEVNAVREGRTDEKGRVKFKKLKPISYFILARKGAINNAGGGERIEALGKGRLNKITVIIE